MYGIRKSGILVLLLCLEFAFCEDSDWICVTTSLGHLNESIFGPKLVNDSLCGAACAGGHHAVSQEIYGYIGVLIAAIFFGTNFIPVKKFDTGDGLFFQWVLCIGIWLVGLVVNIARQQPPFYYPSLIGGFLWTFGNIFCVPIIKMIGLTMGLTVWGVTNLLAGWITGVFIMNDALACPPLNYGGVVTVILSTVVLAFVKAEGKKISSDNDTAPSERKPLINSTLSNAEKSSLSGSLRDKFLKRQDSTGSHQDSQTLTFNTRGSIINGTVDDLEFDEDASWVDKLGKWPRRIIGFSMALGIGFLFGSQFIPVEYMRLCEDGLHSCNELDYIFGHYSGILLSSTLWFVIYCIFKKNKPQVYPKVIIPGLISGIMWGIAMVGWFIANQRLSLSISFPMVTAGPGIISSALGITVFREIRGWKNIGLYFTGFLITLAGLIMVALSHCTVHCMGDETKTN